jgi:heme exporter protein C
MRSTRYAALSRFWPLSGALLPWLWAAAAGFALSGLAVALLHAPADARQGDADRIVCLHLPAAWMAMLIYLAMAAWAAIGWVGNVRLASMLARALAPTGSACAALALVTASLWGKATWGTWWVWDARLTAQLILLLLYAGYLALVESIDDPRRADRAGALVAVVGAVNVPLIYFSLRWWSTLHPGATSTPRPAPSIADGTLLGVALMTLAFWSWSFAIGFVRVRAIVLERERETEWVRALDAPPRQGSATPADLHGAAA